MELGTVRSIEAVFGSKNEQNLPVRNKVSHFHDASTHECAAFFLLAIPKTLAQITIASIYQRVPNHVLNRYRNNHNNTSAFCGVDGTAPNCLGICILYFDQVIQVRKGIYPSMKSVAPSSMAKVI